MAKEEIEKSSSKKKNVVAKNPKKTVKKNSIKEKDDAGIKKQPKKEKTVDISAVDEKIKEKVNKINSKVKKEVIDIKEENLSFSLFEVILLIIITILSCILIGQYLQPKTVEDEKKPEVSEKIDDELQKFIEQYEYIIKNYYGDLDKNEMIKNAITGMLSSLDNYSEVLDNSSNSFIIQLEGEYEGVGIVIFNDDYYNIIIQEVYPDTPAHRAGLQAGDIILKANNMSMQGVLSSDFVNIIKNNGEIDLTVLRNNQEVVVKLKNEKIVLKSVKSEMLENHIGYIDVDIFAANTFEQFKEQLENLERQGLNGLIIDLRDNTGGHLSAVENMISLFLNNKHIIYQTQDKTGTVEKVYSNGNKNKTYKIVILQNGSSASASEIMAAALSEELGAYIIGNRSFGKGTVQQLNSLDGIGQYKFTVKRWLTPRGNWIDGIGITPNLDVSLDQNYYSNPIRENDTQLNSAIEYLK